MEAEIIDMLALCATVFDFASVYMSLVAEVSEDAAQGDIAFLTLADDLSVHALELLDGDLMQFAAVMHDSTGMVTEMSGEDLVEGLGFCREFADEMLPG